MSRISGMSLAFLFPGQGAQYPGMGRDFCETFAPAKQTFEEADDLLKRPLSSLIFNGSEEELKETQNSQLAIFVVSVALLKVIQKLYHLPIAFSSGLSLGEYTALYAAESLSFEAGLKLVDRRAALMSAACNQRKGTMAAVLNLTAGQIEQVIAETGLKSQVWLANLNCPGQIVISGTLDGIDKISQALKAAGAKRVVPLQVHGAFHSPLMKEAEIALKEELLQASLSAPKAKLVQNFDGQITRSLEKMQENLSRQMTGAVLWQKGIEAMQTDGADLYLEVGCGKTLSGFNKRIGASPTYNIEKVEDLKTLEQALKD